MFNLLVAMGIMGFIFFAAALLAFIPILTFITVAKMDSFVMLFYLIWIVLCIISVKCSRSDTIYGKFSIAVMLTVLFDMIFYLGMMSDQFGRIIDRNNYEDILSFLMLPTLSAIPVCWIGYKLRDKPDKNVDAESEDLEKDTKAN